MFSDPRVSPPPSGTTLVFIYSVFHRILDLKTGLDFYPGPFFLYFAHYSMILKHAYRIVHHPGPPAYPQITGPSSRKTQPAPRMALPNPSRPPKKPGPGRHQQWLLLHLI